MGFNPLLLVPVSRGISQDESYDEMKVALAFLPKVLLKNILACFALKVPFFV